MKEFKKGDLVWSPLLGDGTVCDVRVGTIYCVSVAFGNHSVVTFTKGGFSMEEHEHPNLFHRGEVKIKKRKYLGRFADGAPAFAGMKTYSFNLDSMKVESYKLENDDISVPDVNCSPDYSTRELAEQALETYKANQIPDPVVLFPLPDWLIASEHTLNHKVIVVKNALFELLDGLWCKHWDVENVVSDCELQETTLDQLVVGDWFLVDTNMINIIGITAISKSLDIDGVLVFKNGECQDFKQGLADKKYYKIVPKPTTNE